MALVRSRLSPRESGRPRSSTFQPLLPRSPCVLTARYRRGYRVEPTIRRNDRAKLSRFSTKLPRYTTIPERNKDDESGPEKKKEEMFSLRTFIKGIHWHPRIPFRVHFVSLCPYKNENHLVPLHVIITHAHHSTIEYIANTTPTKSIHKSNERLRFSFNFFSLVLEASRQSHGQSTVSPYSLSECVVVRSKGKQRRHR